MIILPEIQISDSTNTTTTVMAGDNGSLQGADNGLVETQATTNVDSTAGAKASTLQSFREGFKQVLTAISAAISDQSADQSTVGELSDQASTLATGVATSTGKGDVTTVGSPGTNQMDVKSELNAKILNTQKQSIAVVTAATSRASTVETSDAVQAQSTTSTGSDKVNKSENLNKKNALSSNDSDDISFVCTQNASSQNLPMVTSIAQQTQVAALTSTQNTQNINLAKESSNTTSGNTTANSLQVYEVASTSATLDNTTQNTVVSTANVAKSDTAQKSLGTEDLAPQSPVVHQWKYAGNSQAQVSSENTTSDGIGKNAVTSGAQSIGSSTPLSTISMDISTASNSVVTSADGGNQIATKQKDESRSSVNADGKIISGASSSDSIDAVDDVQSQAFNISSQSGSTKVLASNSQNTLSIVPHHSVEQSLQDMSSINLTTRIPQQEIESTGLTSGVRTNENSTASTQNPFSAMDASASSGSGELLHKETTQVTVGVNDASLGWVEVKASSSGGDIHASVSADNVTSSAVLATQLAGLHSYLEERQNNVGSLTFIAQGSNAADAFDASEQSANTGSRQQNTDEQSINENQSVSRQVAAISESSGQSGVISTPAISSGGTISVLA